MYILSPVMGIVSRLYRLGLGWSLLVLDALLLLLFGNDIRKYLDMGNTLDSIYTPWLPVGGELYRALGLAGETLLVMLLLIPLVLASVRILVTHFQFGQLSWPLGRVFGIHALLSALLALSVLICSRLQVASGKAGIMVNGSITSETFVFNSIFRDIPVVMNRAVSAWMSDHLSLHHLLFLGGTIILAYLMGREVLGEQQTFLRDYLAASRLADYDPRYLPAVNARGISPPRYSAPPTPAITNAINKAVAAYSRGGASWVSDQNEATKQVREALLHNLFNESCWHLKVRILPDVASALYIAAANDGSESLLVLAAFNHSGVNEALQAWFSGKREVHTIGCDGDCLKPWEEQEESFIKDLRQFVGSRNAVLVLPLVCKFTGQIYDLRSLTTKVKSVSPNVIIILDASFMNWGGTGKMNDMWGAEYVALNLSQWLSCSEPCGILFTDRRLTMDPDWERKQAVSPSNIRTVSSIMCAIDYAFKKSPYFNEPRERSRIVFERMREITDGRLVPAAVPGLSERSYFLALEPASGRRWVDDVVQKLSEAGLVSSISEVEGTTRVTLSFPPYVDFWRSKRLATKLSTLTEPT